MCSSSDGEEHWGKGFSVSAVTRLGRFRTNVLFVAEADANGRMNFAVGLNATPKRRLSTRKWLADRFTSPAHASASAFPSAHLPVSGFGSSSQESWLYTLSMVAALNGVLAAPNFRAEADLGLRRGPRAQNNGGGWDVNINDGRIMWNERRYTYHTAAFARFLIDRRWRSGQEPRVVRTKSPELERRMFD